MTYGSATGIAHPEWVNGRRLWLDPVMEDMIDRVRNGDPLLGWDGDDRLAVYATETDDGLIWEIFRLEDDDKYRFVVRTEPGIPFDARIIHWLVANDKHRRDRHWDLAAEVEKQNTKVREAERAHKMEYITEEVAPRLRRALTKDGY